MNLKFLVGVLILVLATCSIYSPTPRGSGIQGQVLLGPMCPVVQPGQEGVPRPAVSSHANGQQPERCADRSVPIGRTGPF